MADFNRGVSYEINQEITPDILHDLMEETTLTNVGTSDMATNMYMAYIGSDDHPSDAVTGGIHLGTETQLRFYASPAPSFTDGLKWVTSGHDYIALSGATTTIPAGYWVRSVFTNWTGETGTRGEDRIDFMHFQSVSFAHVWGPYMCGVAQEHIPPGERGRVRTSGVTIAFLEQSPGQGVLLGGFIAKSSTATGVGHTFTNGAIPNGMRQVMGMSLDFQPAIATTLVTALCLILR